MRLYALLYHDVIDGTDPDTSGLPGAGAAVYKLDAPTFAQHLDALAQRLTAPPGCVATAAAKPDGSHWLLTFDDGGCSALHPTADLLEQRGWVGHFFVTAGRIGTAGFLDAAAVRELHARGHLIGTHSWSHPSRFSALSPAAMRDEWTRSVRHLQDILGDDVRTASVPGGYYSRDVARAANRAGIRTLFTSEPVARPARIEECLVVGRFAILRHTPPARAAALAAGRAAPRAARWIAWNARKAAKRVGGDFYVTAREALLARNTSR